MLCDFLMMGRDEVSRLMVPARSTEFPGSPMGSYIADEQGDDAVPSGRRSVIWAAQITAPRSLKTLTRSSCLMPRFSASLVFILTIQ